MAELVKIEVKDYLQKGQDLFTESWEESSTQHIQIPLRHYLQE